MDRKSVIIASGAAAVGTGAVIAANSSSTPRPPSVRAAAQPSYSWYRSMMDIPS